MGDDGPKQRSGWLAGRLDGYVDLFGGIAAPHQGSQQRAGGVGLSIPMVRTGRLRERSEAPAGPQWLVTHFPDLDDS